MNNSDFEQEILYINSTIENQYILEKLRKFAAEPSKIPQTRVYCQKEKENNNFEQQNPLKKIQKNEAIQSVVLEVPEKEEISFVTNNTSPFKQPVPISPSNVASEQVQLTQTSIASQKEDFYRRMEKITEMLSAKSKSDDQEELSQEIPNNIKHYSISMSQEVYKQLDNSVSLSRQSLIQKKSSIYNDQVAANNIKQNIQEISNILKNSNQLSHVNSISALTNYNNNNNNENENEEKQSQVIDQYKLISSIGQELQQQQQQSGDKSLKVQDNIPLCTNYEKEQSHKKIYLNFSQFTKNYNKDEKLEAENVKQGAEINQKQNKKQQQVQKSNISSVSTQNYTKQESQIDNNNQKQQSFFINEHSQEVLFRQPQNKYGSINNSQESYEKEQQQQQKQIEDLVFHNNSPLKENKMVFTSFLSNQDNYQMLGKQNSQKILNNKVNNSQNVQTQQQRSNTQTTQLDNYQKQVQFFRNSNSFQQTSSKQLLSPHGIGKYKKQNKGFCWLEFHQLERSKIWQEQKKLNIRKQQIENEIKVVQECSFRPHINQNYNSYRSSQQNTSNIHSQDHQIQNQNKKFCSPSNYNSQKNILSYNQSPRTNYFPKSNLISGSLFKEVRKMASYSELDKVKKIHKLVMNC